MSRAVDEERAKWARVQAIERGRAGLRRLARGLDCFENDLTATETASFLAVSRDTVLRDWHRLGVVRGKRERSVE